MISFAIQADEIAENLKPELASRLRDVVTAVGNGLELVRVAPHQAPAQVGSTVGAVLNRIATDTIDTLRLFTVRAATALPTFLTLKSNREAVLDNLIDPFDLDDIDGDGRGGDTFFINAAKFYGITEDEARELFEDFLVLGLLTTTWWELWLQRQRVNVIQRIASRLADYGISQEVPDDLFGNGGLSDGQKAVIRQAVHDSLLGNDARSAYSTAAGLLTTQTTALTNAVITQTVQRNPETFRGFLWSAVLDTRTCASCSGLDGTRIESDGPFPPLHPLCRCSLIPLLVGEPLPESITFDQWLRSRSLLTQESLLGDKAELYRQGKVQVKDFLALRRRFAPRGRSLRQVQT